MQALHGGDVAGYFAQCGAMPLDFSANLSPLGMPQAARRAAIEAIAQSEHYPDFQCRELCDSLAQAEAVSPHQVVLGNGAADLIFRLVSALHPQRALVTAPTFGEYAQALSQARCEVLSHLLEPSEGFSVTDKILGELTGGVDMVFLCQPNNPTGVLTPRPLMEKILTRCEEIGAILVVDECFIGFLDQPEAFTMAQHLHRKNLVILKAFTKLYAMAGLRLGYCLCGGANGGIAAQLRATGQPWSVSTVAQAAGLGALKEVDYPDVVRAILRKERPWMQGKLQSLGLLPTAPAANFVMFQCKIPLVQPLYQRGILLRSCANYGGLGTEFYRAAIRKREENQQLIHALSQILEENKEDANHE